MKYSILQYAAVLVCADNSVRMCITEKEWRQQGN